MIGVGVSFLRSLLGHFGCTAEITGLVYSAGDDMRLLFAVPMIASSFYLLLFFVANCSHIPPNEIVEKMPGIKAEGAKLSAAFNPVSPREPEIILLMRKTKSSTARTSDRPQSFSGLVKKSHFTWNVYLLSSLRGSSTI